MSRGCFSWQGLRQPKREECPECGKKGLGPWKNLPSKPTTLYRDCRYCQHTETKSVYQQPKEG